MLLLIYPKPKNTRCKLSPLVGESGSGADERGKLEQKRKNDSNLCTPTRPYRLAGSALPSVFGGSERLKKKEFMIFI